MLLQVISLLLTIANGNCLPADLVTNPDSELTLYKSSTNRQKRKTFMLQMKKKDTVLKRSTVLPKAVRMVTVELVKKHGYPIEVYEDIATEDGYLLTMHRIPYGKNNSGVIYKPIVFIMHGILSSSADMILTGPDRAMAYYFADKGYDVFLGNARGNTYGKKHKTLDPVDDKKDFWKFSWHEIGFYDVPALIDEIIKITGQEQLYYIGHSQGTTAFFVMVSEKPEYNQKVKLMSAMSPMVYVNNIKNEKLLFLCKLAKLGEVLDNLLNLHEVLPQSDMLPEIGEKICENKNYTQICADIIESLIDVNECSKQELQLLLAHFPAGSSTKQFFHYAQEITSGLFQQYDYGLIGNYIKYKTAKPPLYNLSNVETDIALFYGGRDTLSTEQDVLHLFNDLKNVVELMKIEDFRHGDFIRSGNARKFVYSEIANLIEMTEHKKILI